jgi:hypothetical protein
MFETALRYLVDSDDRAETILLGGVLTLLSWLLIPAVFVVGYFQRVLARTNAGDPAPSFDDWGDLFGDGLKAIGVALAYFAVPAIFLTTVLMSLLAFSVETTVSESSPVTDPGVVADTATSAGPDLLSVVIVLGGLALSGITALAAWYVLPAALARVAVEDRFGAAFEFRELAGVLTSGSYATGWLLALVVIVVDGAVISGLASIPFLGWALIPFAVFYLNVVTFALYGQGYRDATGTGRREPVDSDQQTSV